MHTSRIRGFLTFQKKNLALFLCKEVDVAHSRDLEAEAQVASADQNVQASISRLQAAKASLEHENALYAYTRIVSPLDGVITQRYASDGAMIQAGTSSNTQAMPVVHIAKDDILRLMLPVPEDYVGTIHNGEVVAITLPALNRSLTGSVTRFSDSVQPTTRTMTAEVDLKNPKRDLIPGMYAQVQLDLADLPNAVAVPLGAIDSIGKTGKVYEVDSAGVVHLQSVNIGLQTPNFVQVLSGIEPGDAVLLGTHSTLQDGEKVQPRFE